jgi:hypothetical protein
MIYVILFFSKITNTDILTFAPTAPRAILLLQFDLDHSGRYLVTPSHGSSHRQAASRSEDEAPANGVLRIYDLWGQGAAVAGEVSCPSPWISGVSLHPTQVRKKENNLLARLHASHTHEHTHTHTHTHTHSLARTHARTHARARPRSLDLVRTCASGGW